MQTFRAFIAAEIDPVIKEKIHQIILNLKKQVHEGIRWASDQNIHLTIKFYGNIQQDKLTILVDAMQSAFSMLAPIKINLAELGAFPDHRRPRVVWIGIKSQPELEKLAAVIEDLATKSGVKPEDRAFSAHITIGRVEKTADYLDILKIGETVSATKIGEIGTQMVNELIVFKSDLQPEGPVYSQLYKLKLRK